MLRDDQESLPLTPLLPWKRGPLWATDAANEIADEMERYAGKPVLRAGIREMIMEHYQRAVTRDPDRVYWLTESARQSDGAVVSEEPARNIVTEHWSKDEQR